MQDISQASASKMTTQRPVYDIAPYFSPTTPATINPTDTSLTAVRLSPSSANPRNTVPSEPMAVQIG
ncbi:hypothetical protein D3C84_1120820 [compost metagenome]